MMFATLNGQGVPVTVSSKDQGGMVEIPDGTDPFTVMFTGGVWITRPSVTFPTVAGNTMTIETYPVGTTVEVVDLDDRAVLFSGTFDGSLTFQDAGSYQIEVTPPAPWIGWSGRIVRP